MSKKPKLIIVDDDVDLTDILTECVELFGLSVVGVGHDGKEAAELYAELNPDLVLLDAIMPNYDGFYAISQIKEMNPDAKIIALTAEHRPETIDRLKRENVLILSKPFDTVQFSSICNQIANHTPFEVICSVHN